MAPDWNKIKLKYASSTMSYEEIAEKFANTGATISEIKRHGKDDNWVQARKDYREKLYQKTAEKTAERQSEVLAKLMSASSKTADVIDQLAGNRDYFFPETTDFGGNTRRNFSGRDLREFTIAIKELTGTIRDLYGIPTKMQQQRWELEKEKWALEKKLKERDLDEDNTKRIEVVIAPELEDYTV